MANKATKSLTAGMKVLGGANIPTYTLEYLTGTNRKKQGEFETIVVPYIELGRDSKCGVRFGDDTPTVSRKHAAITRENGETKILNLSTSNPTLVNGRPVKSEFYLNNGDEIQLSLEGPRLRYNTTKSGTAKIGFTSKMNLVMQQSIRPYKVAASMILALFIMVSIGGGYYISELIDQTDQLDSLTRAQAETIADLNRQNEDFSGLLSQSQEQLEVFRQRHQELSQNLEEQRRISDSLSNIMASGTVRYSDLVESVNDHVLGIFETHTEITINDNTTVNEFTPRLMCTGFLMGNGVFVTARHCIDGYTDRREWNFIDHSGGEVTAHFTARNHDGSIEFNFTNKDLVADYDQDALVNITHRGIRGVIRSPDYFSGADWAYVQTNFNRGVSYDKSLSQNLRSGTNMFVLGYSYGMDFRRSGSLEPYFSTANVTQTGIHDGIIQVSEAGFDGGNSGGPVFTVVDGEAVAVGIVTGTFRKPEWIQAIDQSVMVDANIQIVTPLAHF